MLAADVADLSRFQKL